LTEHEEFAELLPGLALGSLDSAEERELREHLARCAECRTELASLRSLVGELALSLPSSPPPAGLEERIMSALPPAQRRHQSRKRRLPLMAAAMALIAVLGAGNIVQWQHGRGAAAPRNPRTLVTLTLEGRGSETFGTMVLDPDDSEGVLAVRGLSILDPARTYQLWLVKGGLRGSGGLFTVDAHGYGSLLLDVPPELRGFESFIVTTEPRGGSPAPSAGAVMEGHR
jgi:anti-sigma-K factor RskA